MTGRHLGRAWFTPFSGPEGHEIRSQALSTYNPFADLPASDRRLVLLALSDLTPTVDVANGNADQAIREHLRASGSVDLASPTGDNGRVAALLRSLVAEPIEFGFLQVYPRIVGVSRRPHVVVRLEIDEAFQ